MCARVNDNRAGGYRCESGAIPPADSLSRVFHPTGEPCPAMSLDDMIAQAKLLGFRDAELPYAKFLLGRYSFQHLSEYFPLITDNEDIPTDFYNLYITMQFDHDFQAILLRYIGMFELQLRARYSMTMSEKFGAFAHRDPSRFSNQNYFDGYLKEYARVLEACINRRGSKAAESIAKYGDMPIWEAVEEMPFGVVSRLYKNTKSRQVKEEVANSFGANQGDFANWLKSLAFVRNRCAHFGKLLGSDLAILPRAIANVDADNRNPFFIVLLLMHLLRTNLVLPEPMILPQVMISFEIYALMDKYDPLIIRACGIPNNWLELMSDPDVSGMNLIIAENYEKDQDGNPVTDALKKRSLEMKIT